MTEAQKVNIDELVKAIETNGNIKVVKGWIKFTTEDPSVKKGWVKFKKVK